MRGYVVYSTLPFFIRIQVFWTKMEYIPSDDDLIVDENDTTSKRLYLSKGDTPGKPNKKISRIPLVENPSSSRALFQSPATSPKPKVRHKNF